MALTVTKVLNLNRAQEDGTVVYGGVYDVTFDASYPTGGETLAATDIDEDASNVEAVFVQNASGVISKQVRWDEAADKLMVFVEDGTSGIHAQAANASDQSTLTVSILAFAS